MTAWQCKEVEVLPKFEDREPCTYYKTPDGMLWYPNNMGELESSTHWVKGDDYWDKLERELDAEYAIDGEEKDGDGR